MLRFLFLRFILPLIVFLIIRSILKSIWGSVNSSVPSRQAKDEGVQPGGELRQDPVCGTYVAVNSSLSRTVNGKPVYFCSAACRDKYRAA